MSSEKDMIWKQEIKDGEELEKFYVGFFTSKFGTAPKPVESGDRELFVYLMKTFKKEKAEKLLCSYFDLDVDWLKQKGYPLSLLKDNINAVIMNSPGFRGTKPYYVVALSESGFPVLSYSDKIVEGYEWFKPVLYDVWLKQSYEERSQHTKEQLENPANAARLKMWFDRWDRFNEPEPPIWKGPVPPEVAAIINFGKFPDREGDRDKPLQSIGDYLKGKDLREIIKKGVKEINESDIPLD